MPQPPARKDEQHYIDGFEIGKALGATGGRARLDAELDKERSFVAGLKAGFDSTTKPPTAA